MLDLSRDASSPILKWVGGKRRMLKQYLPLLQHIKFDSYIEPFLGAGAVFLSLDHPYSNCASLLNDANDEVMNVHRQTREQPYKLMDELVRMSAMFSELFFYDVRANPYTADVLGAARTIFLNKTCFNGLYRQNKKGNFNSPFGHAKKCPQLFDRENMLAVSRRLQYAILASTDFENVIACAGQGSFIYCDPPYEPISLGSSFTKYTANGFTQNDQRRLKTSCDAAIARGATVCISNSSCEFIVDLYSSNQYTINRVMCGRSINSVGAGRQPIEEFLIIGK
jgi:DNA adenine methylase